MPERAPRRCGEGTRHEPGRPRQAHRRAARLATTTRRCVDAKRLGAAATAQAGSACRQWVRRWGLAPVCAGSPVTLRSLPEVRHRWHRVLLGARRQPRAAAPPSHHSHFCIGLALHLDAAIPQVNNRGAPAEVLNGILDACAWNFDMLDQRLVVYRRFDRVLPLVSDRRLKAIEDAVKTLNFDNRQTVDAARRALTHMGLLDQFCDWFSGGHNKAKALEALATLFLFQLAEDPKHNPNAVNPESLLSNRQVACRTLAAGVTASGKTMLLQSDDTNAVANAFTEFLTEEDWRCLAAEVRRNDGKEAPCQASCEKAAYAFTAAADKHAQKQWWAQEAAMRQAAAEAFTAAFTAARQAGAAFVGDLLAKAADAQWLAVAACEKTRPGGLSRPDRELSGICVKAALAAQQAAEAALRDEDKDKYIALAVHAYTLVGQYTDVAKIHRQRAQVHLSQCRFTKAAEAFHAAALAEREGKRPGAAAIDFLASADALLKIPKLRQRFFKAGAMYDAAASAYRDDQQYRNAASAAQEAAAAYERDCQPFSMVSSLTTAAQALARVPDPLGAAALWEQVANLHHSIGFSRIREALAYTEAGNAYKEGRAFDLARVAHEKAATRYEALGDVERATAAWQAANECLPMKLDMAAFETMAPDNDQLIVDINAKITAHQVALQSQNGLKLAERTLLFDNLCCFFEGVKFVPGTRDEFVLLFSGNVGTFFSVKGAERLIRTGRHHIERRALDIDDIYRGKKLWALLSQVT